MRSVFTIQFLTLRFPVAMLVASRVSLLAVAESSREGQSQATAAPQGAPSILLILLDDVAFADTSTFGGSAQTPARSNVAAEGLPS